MTHYGRGASITALTYIESPATYDCACLPLSTLHKVPWHEHAQEATENFGQVTPATAEINSHLRAILNDCFPRSTPLSVLLLHISQLERIHISPKSAILHKRQRYHAPPYLLEQILANIRRDIRSTDHILVHAGAGFAMILPDVDRQGAQGILERVYHNINFLQPETVVPPLKRETEILIGISSYPDPGTTLEDLLYHTGLVAQRLTLRPAIMTQLRSTRPANLPQEIAFNRRRGEEDHFLAAASSGGIPFMKLPTRLPSRLRPLIPHQLALELRCAPVGRDHTRLTVAMAHPTDTHAIDRLRETTNMAIFPVSCDVGALDQLLTHEW